MSKSAKNGALFRSTLLTIIDGAGASDLAQKMAYRFLTTRSSLGKPPQTVALLCLREAAWGPPASKATVLIFSLDNGLETT